MSTVLWANILINGEVQSDQADKWALYKHQSKLNRLSRNLHVASFNDACDDTDLRFHFDQQSLPPGMQSTDQLMASKGRWLDVDQAERMLETLLLYITTQKLRFGWLRDDRLEVERELKDSIHFLQQAKVGGGKFNFSIVS